MRLGKTAAYAVLATLHIAQHRGNGPVQGREVAEACRIPPESLLKILQHLVRGQVLQSIRGRGGGFVLRKPAERTTLLDIVQAVEGPLEDAFSPSPNVHGPRTAVKKMAGVWQDVALHTKSVLRTTTLDQLMKH